MSTRMSKRKATAPTRPPSWLLSMSLGDESRLLPLVYLCGTKDTAQMIPISETPADNLLSFQLKDSDLGNICKVRLKTQSKSLLKLSEKEAGIRKGASLVYIRKVSDFQSLYTSVFRCVWSTMPTETKFVSLVQMSKWIPTRLWNSQVSGPIVLRCQVSEFSTLLINLFSRHCL